MCCLRLALCPRAAPPTSCAGPQVLPSLRDHRDEFLLRELLKRWNNHKVMVRWLSRFFNYLDRRAGTPGAPAPLPPRLSALCAARRRCAPATSLNLQLLASKLLTRSGVAQVLHPAALAALAAGRGPDALPRCAPRRSCCAPPDALRGPELRCGGSCALVCACGA